MFDPAFLKWLDNRREVRRQKKSRKRFLLGRIILSYNERVKQKELEILKRYFKRMRVFSEYRIVFKRYKRLGEKVPYSVLRMLFEMRSK
tara:strand:- start:39 stop:305 length:267 start_codon:yes stop_codon:yes gene_type:complete